MALLASLQANMTLCAATGAGAAALDQSTQTATVDVSTIPMTSATFHALEGGYSQVAPATDRNQKENEQARAIVRDALRILRQNNRDNVSEQDLREIYHRSIAPRYKVTNGGQDNAGSLEHYEEQLEDLLSFYEIDIESVSSTPAEVANYLMRNHSVEALIILTSMDVRARNELHALVIRKLNEILAANNAGSYEGLSPEQRIDFQDKIWPRMRDQFIRDYYA